MLRAAENTKILQSNYAIKQITENYFITKTAINDLFKH